MWAAVYEELGPAREVLSVKQFPVPDPAPGEVRVRIRLSGVNPSDWRARLVGRGVPITRQIPHSDGVGTIDAVGHGVSASRIGERVWTWNAAWMREHGTAAQFVCLPARQAVPLPDSVSDEQAAGLGIPFMTAWHALTRAGSIDGRTVLVAGGAGAVGNAAIALGKYLGATVITTVSSEAKAELAERAGADVVVNYRDHDAAAQIRAMAPDGVHRIIELAPGANMELDLEVIADRGSIVVYAPEPQPPSIPVQRLMRANIALEFILVYTIGADAENDAVNGVSTALRGGHLHALPTHRFPLEQVADAHEAVENAVTGKVVVELPEGGP